MCQVDTSTVEIEDIRDDDYDESKWHESDQIASLESM